MPFDADEIEDGSGKPTAIVYGRTADPVAEAVAWLTRRRRTALSLVALAATQEAHLINGTEYVEALCRETIDGRPVHHNQRLLLPRYDLWPHGGTYVDDLPLNYLLLPDLYLEGIYIATELAASGKPLLNVTDTSDAQVKSEQTGRGLFTEWFRSHSKLEVHREVESKIAPFITVGRLDRG